MTKPIYIVGPTGVGKSGIASVLAGSLDGEIVSSDAMQIYRGLDIGTDKPSKEERAIVPHHLIDLVDIHESFNVARFIDVAKKAIIDIQRRKRVPIIVGGTGLYIRALLDGIFDVPGLNPEVFDKEAVRERWLEFVRVEGREGLHQKLRQIDPSSATKIHPHNIRRVIRALEVFEETGIPMSSLQQQWPKPAKDVCLVGLMRDRVELYHRIEMRVDHMVSKGLLGEVRALLNRGIEKNPIVIQAIGYKELVHYFRDKNDLDETIQLIKRNSRHLAKRQMTWFRRDSRVFWVHLDAIDENKAISIIMDHYKQFLS